MHYLHNKSGTFIVSSVFIGMRVIHSSYISPVLYTRNDQKVGCASSQHSVPSTIRQQRWNDWSKQNVIISNINIYAQPLL